MPRKLLQPEASDSAHWPPLETDDRDVVTFVVTSKPDALGRERFWIRWYDENRCHLYDKLDPRPEGWRRGWRAQHYHSVRRIQEAYWRHTTRLRVEVVFELEP